MNKIRVTNKEMREGFENIIKVNYCGLQSMLYFKNPEYYNCGVYGWNCDYYVINENTVICTGYRPTGNIQPNYDIIREYEQKAEQIRGSRLDYDEEKQKMNQLINSFIKKIIKE